MSHSNTELLIDYWQNRFSRGRAPARSDINPADFPTLLPQVFILGRQGAGQYAVRLAGGLVRDLHGRDLRGIDFSTLWGDDSRLPLQAGLERVRRSAEPFGARVLARAGTNVTELEVTLLPLSADPGGIERVLGLYQPLTPLARLRGLVVEELILAGPQSERSGSTSHIRLAAVGGQRVG